MLEPLLGHAMAAALAEGLKLELGVSWWVFWVSLGRQAHVPDTSVLSFRQVSSYMHEC